jgi:hypothetical protein
MKRIALSVLAILGMVGCSSAPTVSYETDHAKVAAIERAAAATGVKILWINRPQKAVSGG